MKWIDALKEWNKEKSVHKQVWCIPKKDSTEYKEVIDKMKGNQVKEIKKPKYVLDYENKSKNLLDKYVGENATQVKGKSKAIKSLLNSNKQDDKVEAWYEKNYPKPKIDNKKINEDFVLPKMMIKKKKGVISE